MEKVIESHGILKAQKSTNPATGAFSWRHTSLIILKSTTSPFPEKSDRYKKKKKN